MKEIEIREINQNLDLKEFIYERIETNANLFSDSEMTIINNNRSLMQKIYFIGILDNVKINAIFNATPKKSYKK